MNEYEIEAVQLALKAIVSTFPKEQRKLAEAHFMDLMSDKVKNLNDEENQKLYNARSLMLDVFEKTNL